MVPVGDAHCAAEAAFASAPVSRGVVVGPYPTRGSGSAVL